MKFVSTSFTPQGDNKYKLVGNLTIRDVTKPVTFDVKYGGTASAFGGTHAGFKATTKIDRFDYNLKWSKATEAGGLVAGKGCGNHHQRRFQEIIDQTNYKKEKAIRKYQHADISNFSLL